MPEQLLSKKLKYLVFQTVFEEYQKLAGKSIEDSIKSETHGSLEDAMLAIGKSGYISLYFVWICCLSPAAVDCYGMDLLYKGI